MLYMLIAYSFARHCNSPRQTNKPTYTHLLGRFALATCGPADPPIGPRAFRLASLLPLARSFVIIVVIIIFALVGAGPEIHVVDWREAGAALEPLQQGHVKSLDFHL